MATIKSLAGHIFIGWPDVWKDILSIQKSLESKKSPIGQYAVILLLIVVLWFIYIPIHELLHAWGCIVTGGTVSELIIGKEYGAAYLQRIFPFVKPETSQYAGRLTGFIPNGDLSYFFTVFAPYLLSLFPGVLLIRLAITQNRLLLLAPGFLTGFIPFANLTGDYFEMGGILSTRLIDALSLGNLSSSIPQFLSLRSDDLFRLISEIQASPSDYGFGSPGLAFASVMTILVSMILSIWLAGATYAWGRWIAHTAVRSSREPT